MNVKFPLLNHHPADFSGLRTVLPGHHCNTLDAVCQDFLHGSHLGHGLLLGHAVLHPVGNHLPVKFQNRFPVPGARKARFQPVQKFLLGHFPFLLSVFFFFFVCWGSRMASSRQSCPHGGSMESRSHKS